MKTQKKDNQVLAIGTAILGILVILFIAIIALRNTSKELDCKGEIIIIPACNESEEKSCQYQIQIELRREKILCNENGTIREIPSAIESLT